MRDKKGLTHVAAVAAIAAFIALGLACATSSTPTRTKPAKAANTQAKPAAPQGQAAKATDRTTELKEIAANNPNDAKAQYDLGRRLYSPDNNFVQAAAAWEKALAIDPDYIVAERFQWYPKTASTFGVSIKENLQFGDFSLFFFLGIAYHDGATYMSRPGSSSTTGFPENEKTGALEKSLAAFRKGYEIDIESGKNADTNLKILYLAYIAKISDLLGRKNEADVSYRELATVATLTPEIAQRINPGQKPAMPAAAQGAWWDRAPEFAGLSLAQLQSKFPGKNVRVGQGGGQFVVEQFPMNMSNTLFVLNSQGKANRWFVLFPAIAPELDKAVYEQALRSFTAAYGEPRLSQGTQKMWTPGNGLPKGITALALDVDQAGVHITHMYGF